MARPAGPPLSPANSITSRSSSEWPCTCLLEGVLRITVPKLDDNPPVFILEGRLAGAWARELLRVTREIPRDSPCVFNLEDVFYVDSLGEAALAWLNRFGAVFITGTAYGKDLRQRLQLRRTVVAATGARENPGRPGASPRK